MPQREQLTEREREILMLIVSGLGDRAIGERLAIARGTVSNHVAVILLKLHAANRTEAVAIAMRDGLIKMPPPG